MGEGFVPAVYWGGADFRRLLRDIEDLYGGAFDELGPGALQDFKHMIDCVDAFLDLLADSKTDFWAELMCYGRLRMDVLEFCQFYASWLGNPLMERLKAEIYELLEEAMGWWDRQEVYNEMEGWRR